MSDGLLSRLPASPLARPERTPGPPSALARSLRHAAAPLAARWLARDTGRHAFLRQVAEAAPRFDGRSPGVLAEALPTLRRRLLAEGFADPVLAEAFALLRALSQAVLGLRHHDEQLLGARLLMRGRLAEMATGEGKSLTAATGAACAALAGVPVHLVTVNDYLAERDALEMAPLYRALGLRAAHATANVDEAGRRAAYAASVTYCDNKILVFDYLRDRLRLGAAQARSDACLRELEQGGLAGGLLLRGLHFAIVDEADSVLVDEARTPLILSGPGRPDGSEEIYREALGLACALRQGEDFLEAPDGAGFRLTPRGEWRVAQLSAGWGGVWAGVRRRHALATQALTALHRLRRDRDYLVADGKVQIIDPHTGRVMADRKWSQGLQQLVELKEGLEPSRPGETLARISYQRFFRRYHHLCGLSGTAREVAGELWRVYGLPVSRVPTHRPVRRSRSAPRLYATAEAKWVAVAEEVARLRARGLAVLVGCDSVDASQTLSGVLEARGIPHQVLNARQSADEAALVAAAGRPGQVTVTTQMAGRGTDIKLDPAVREAGGLQVLLTACQEARRIDRQLEGRCARQGDPGRVCYLLSAEDELVRRWRPAWLPLHLPGRAGLALMRLWQYRAERAAARQRHWVQRQDEQEEELMAFAGVSE